jgi:uncharacterized tellurite resistance protein B-like protein
MLNRIQTFFDEYMAAGSRIAEEPDASARCAAAALLLEMAHMDDTMAPVEQAAIFNAVRASFDLSPEQTEELIACAHEERDNATDYHQFTSLITANFDAAQRAHLVEQLWQVAYADQVLCQHEEYLVRKVANLLHVPHSVFISVKHRAMDSSQD